MTCERLLVMLTATVFVFLNMDYIPGGEGVRIRDMQVPNIVLNGTDKPAVLDCDYTLDEPASKSGLVVKWFFNNHPAPVYQWIYNKRPQYLGVLKGRVNHTYRATQDESTMYRGFQILTPTVELSGDYKCLVSTFDKEDSRSKKMVVYVPEKSMDVNHGKPREDMVIVNCTAEGLFPEPNITILADKLVGHSEITTRKQINSSLFDIVGSLLVSDEDLNSPTTFMCELSIPDANYSQRKNVVYFPGPPTTPSVVEETVESLPTSRASGSVLSPSFLGLLILSLISIFSQLGL